MKIEIFLGIYRLNAFVLFVQNAKDKTTLWKSLTHVSRMLSLVTIHLNEIDITHRSVLFIPLSSPLGAVNQNCTFQHLVTLVSLSYLSPFVAVRIFLRPGARCV